MLDFENAFEGFSFTAKGSASTGYSPFSGGMGPKISSPKKPKKPKKPANKLATRVKVGASVRAAARPVLSRNKASSGLMASVRGALQRAIPAVKPQKPAVKAKIGLTVTPRVSKTLQKAMNETIAAGHKISPHMAFINTPGNIKRATNLTEKAVMSLARKAPILKPACPQTKAKALKAIAPIAAACTCQPAPVVKKLSAKLACKGYPPNTATSLLAGIHDMNTALEKAAIQRLATHEHKTLSKKHTFEHQVLRQLSRLAKRLPECHPVRTKAHLVVLRKA